MASVARVRWAKFRVATVAVVSIVILCTLLYELFGGVLLAPKATAYLYIPDASGLSGESPVRVDGIDVGRVSSVELSGAKDPSRVVKVTLMLYRDRLRGIPADSVAQISSDTLVGDKFVDITSGTSVTRIPAGGELNYKFQPELLKSLDLTEFTRQLRLVDQTLADIENGRSSFGQFYHGEGFYDDLITRLKELHTGFQAAVSTTSMVGGLLSTDRLYRQAGDFLRQLDGAVAKVQSGPGPAAQLLRDSRQYDEFLARAKELHASVEKLGKSDLLQSDAAWVNANRTLAAWLQAVDEINRNPALATTATYDNLDGAFRELRDEVRDFRTNPRKYLRMKLF